MDSRFNGLLEPISDIQPCGEDLSFSPEFDRIQEARREDDPTIDYGEWQAALKQADWHAVVQCCTDLLQNRCKDLRLAAWLAEGLVKLSGLRGLADGMEITAGLLVRFGANLHPQAEAGDLERHIGNMSWFGTRMAQLVKQIPLTVTPRFNLNDYESACLLQSQLQRNPDAVADIEHRVTLEKFSAAVARSDKAIYMQWLVDAEHCRLAHAELVKAADVHFGQDGPSFSALAGSIEMAHQRLQAIARERGIASAVSSIGERGDLQGESGSHSSARPVLAGGPIASRAQALDLLRQVAEFFRQTEPHSPVAYLADKAAHWGAMPLHAWLRSVVKDNGTLSHLEELLGMEADGKANG